MKIYYFVRSDTKEVVMASGNGKNFALAQATVNLGPHACDRVTLEPVIPPMAISRRIKREEFQEQLAELYREARRDQRNSRDLDFALAVTCHL